MRLLLARSGIVLLVLSLANCSTWNATRLPLSELERQHIRITTKSGEKHEGDLVDADSLGFAVLHSEFAKPSVMTLDTATITLVEKSVHSDTRTLGLIMIPVALVIGLVVLANGFAEGLGQAGN